MCDNDFRENLLEKEKDLVMKRILCSCVGVFVVSAAVSAADTWYWTGLIDEPIPNQTSTSTWGRNANNAGNWTNLVTHTTGVPQEGDTIVYSSDYAVNSYVGFSPIISRKLAEIRCEKGSFDFRQSNLKLMDGGRVVFEEAAVSKSWTGGLVLNGTGTVDVKNSSVTFAIQKSFEGSTSTLIKEGPGMFRVCEDGGVGTTRKYLVPTTSLRGGSVAINIGTCWPLTSGAELRFDSNDGDIRYVLGSVASKYNDPEKYGVVIPNGALVESVAVSNTSHGVSSSVGNKLWFTGTPKVADMVFTGTFYGSAGLVWLPDDPGYTFTFKKAVHETTGEIAVSNGTVRVTDGASFPHISLVTVRGANARFEVTATAVAKMPAAMLAISDGGKVNVAGGVHLDIASAKVNGAAVADGLYCRTGSAIAAQADWVDGDGIVCVGSAPGAAQTTANWTGDGTGTLSGTAANWSGGVPTLTDGGTFVNVQGGAGFTAADDLWLKGFDLKGSAAFTLAAVAGKDFWLGSGGILGGTGTYTINAPLTFTTEQHWNFKNGATVNFNVPLDAFGASELFVNGTTAVYNVNSSLGPKGFQVHFEHKSTVNIAAGVTNNADIRIWNDQTDPNAGDYYWSNGTYKKPIVFKGGAPTVMNGFLHNTSTEHTVTFEPNANVTFNAGFLGRNTTTLNVGAGARVRFNKPFLNRNGFYANFDATGVFEMNAEGNCFGYANPWSSVFSKGTVKLLVPYALKDFHVPDGTFEYKGVPKTDAEAGRFEIAGSAVLDFCGNDQSLKCLAARGGTITSETDAVLTLNANNNWTAALGPTSRVDKATWTGGVGLVYNGKDANWPRFMMNVSSTTGRLEVVQGRLVFPKASGDKLLLTYGSEAVGYYPRPSKDASWTNCCEVTVRGGTLELEHKNTFGRQVAVKFVKTGNAYGKINLAEGVSEKVYSLEIDGEDQRRGTYGATGSGAQHVNDTLFAGGGVLSVVGDGLGMTIIFK